MGSDATMQQEALRAVRDQVADGSREHRLTLRGRTEPLSAAVP